MKQLHAITEPYFKAVLNFRLIQQSEVVHLPLFQRNIRCREGGRTSSAVKGTLRQRLTALRLTRLRRSQPRFARHLTVPRPLHAALPCGGGRPQSSLTLTPPAVKGAYFSLLTVNLNRAIFSACCGNKTAKYSDSAMPKSPGLGEKRGWPFPGTGTGQEGAALG